MCEQDDARDTVLYVETYPSGSHGRILDLLTQHSRLRIESIRGEREHWRWLAIAAHHAIIEQIKRRRVDKPDLIICSGPLNVSAFLGMLPPDWRDVPRVVYFHESQWTYPTNAYDPRPYLLSHIDGIRLADEAWFNSRYHLDTFWATATSPAAPCRVRDLARLLRPEFEPKCRVVYPPVSVNRRPAIHHGHMHVPTRLLWNARWELDKRPDRFIEMLDRLQAAGHAFEVLVMGIGNADPAAIRADLGSHSSRVAIPGHFEDRSAYETAVASADLIVSTADHEFFGVSVLEAAQLGVTPVLPSDLAYPETQPSAYFYRAGDPADLERVVGHLLSRPRSALTSHRIEAMRYVPERSVSTFDRHCLRLIATRRV